MTTTTTTAAAAAAALRGRRARKRPWPTKRWRAACIFLSPSLARVRTCVCDACWRRGPQEAVLAGDIEGGDDYDVDVSEEGRQIAKFLDLLRQRG